DDVPAFVLPEQPLLTMPTLAEIVATLGADPIHSADTDRDREVTGFKIAAMTLPNVLDHLTDGSLVLVPGDRPAILLGAFVSRLADTFPDVAGVILTGGFRPEPRVQRLLDGLGDVPLPVFAVVEDTFVTAQAVANVPAVIGPRSTRKIATALGLFEEHVDTATLAERIAVTRSARVTPLMFEYDLIERARADKRHIVLPEGTDDRILTAAGLLTRRG